MNMTKESLNLPYEVDALLKVLQKTGWKGIRPLRIQRESIWHPKYAIFIIEWLFPDYNDDQDCEYCTPRSFDVEQFKVDFQKHVSDMFPDCQLRMSFHSDEYELVGRDYKAFSEKYGDALEAEYEKSLEHRIWIPEGYKFE